jgi:hypothetical protein
MQNSNVPALLIGSHDVFSSENVASSCGVIMVYGGDYVLLGKVKKATRYSLGMDSLEPSEPLRFL